jgi:predicted ATP-grasp superfamily ATP-dependent carboligase
MCGSLAGLAGEIALPNAFLSPEGYVATINRAAQSIGQVLLLPAHDDIFVASEQSSNFSELVSVMAPPLSPLMALHDKYNLYRLGQGSEVCCPDTRLLTDLADLSKAAKDWGYPLILKPRYGEGSAGVFRIRDERQVIDQASLVRELVEQDYLIQAYAKGVGVGVGCLVMNGRVLALSQHIRLREVPISGGTSTARTTFYDRKLESAAEYLMAQSGLNGIAMFEFRYDVLSGAASLLDANPRYWGSLANHIRSGVDFPKLHLESFLEPPGVGIKTRRPTQEVETRWLLGEVRALAELALAGRWAEARNVFRKPKDRNLFFEDFDGHGIAPLLAQTRSYLRRALSARQGNDFARVKRVYFESLARRV